MCRTYNSSGNKTANLEKNSYPSDITFTYDFGDNWIHEVVVENVLKAGDKYSSYPVCLDGERQRLPEDVGGIGGYEEFIRIISDRNHPDYENMLIWAEKDTI